MGKKQKEIGLLSFRKFMFKLFQINWNNRKNNIDLSKLVRFDSKSISNTFLTTQVEETCHFCKMALNTDIFTRGDYRELLELTLMYLSPEMVFQI